MSPVIHLMLTPDNAIEMMANDGDHITLAIDVAEKTDGIRAVEAKPVHVAGYDNATTRTDSVDESGPYRYEVFIEAGNHPETLMNKLQAALQQSLANRDMDVQVSVKMP